MNTRTALLSNTSVLLRALLLVAAPLSLGASSCPAWVNPNLPLPNPDAGGPTAGPLLADGKPAYYDAAYTLTFTSTDLQALQQLAVWAPMAMVAEGTDSAAELTLHIPVRVQPGDRDRVLSDFIRELRERSQWRADKSAVYVPQRSCGVEASGRVQGLCLGTLGIRVPRTTDLQLELAWQGVGRFSRLRAHSLTLRAPAAGLARVLDSETNVILTGGGSAFDLIAKGILSSDTTHSDAGDLNAKLDLFRTLVLEQIQGRVRVSTAQPANPVPYLRVDGKVIPALPFERP